MPEKTTLAIRTKMELHQSNTHQSGTASNQAAPSVPQKTMQATRTKMELHQWLPCVTREKTTTTQFGEGGSIGQRGVAVHNTVGNCLAGVIYCADFPAALLISVE